MDKKIIFYAPVGTGLPQHQLGGGEKGCRRTHEILTNAGYSVSTIDKPVTGKGMANYIKMAIKAYCKVIQSLIHEKQSILYVVGFYEKNVYLEWLNVFTGKMLGHKVIYEARNGRLVKAYYKYGKLYKIIMGAIIKKADLLFAQGLEYVEFIKQNYGKKAVYTPNYVMNRSLKPYVGNRPFDLIRFIYFGRVSESKNVGTVISAAAELKRKGYKTITTIIGGYTEEYRNELDGQIAREGLEANEVVFMGQQNFEVISEELQKSHFFVFPSQEKMEGHSNSLTEAMTFGVVPVVSTAGFNESILAKPELVVEEINSIKYAEIVEKILKEGTWNCYSQFVYQRIKENYTEDIVRNAILTAIQSIK